PRARAGACAREGPGGEVCDRRRDARGLDDGPGEDAAGADGQLERLAKAAAPRPDAPPLPAGSPHAPARARAGALEPRSRRADRRRGGALPNPPSPPPPPP